MGKPSELTPAEQRKLRKEIRSKAIDACEEGNVFKLNSQCQMGQLDGSDLNECLRIGGSYEKVGIVLYLLELGVEPNQLELGYLPRRLSLDVLRLLGEFELDVKAKGKALLRDNLGNREYVEWVLNQGVNLGIYRDPIRNNRNGYPVDNTDEFLNEAASMGDTALFDLFVRHGAIPSNSIALHKVTECKNPELAASTIDHLVRTHHMDINADDLCGGLRWHHSEFRPDPLDSGSPLACAVRRGNEAAVRSLLTYGAEISNYRGVPKEKLEYNTPPDNTKHLIRRAVIVGLMPVIRMLLDAGADASAGYTEAIYLIRYRIDRKEAARVCKEYGGDLEEDIDEAGSGNEERGDIEIQWDKYELNDPGDLEGTGVFSADGIQVRSDPLTLCDADEHEAV